MLITRPGRAELGAGEASVQNDLSCLVREETLGTERRSQYLSKDKNQTHCKALRRRGKIGSGRGDGGGMMEGSI